MIKPQFKDLTLDEKAKFLEQKKIRMCIHEHKCCICGYDIVCRQMFYDGGAYNNRAHTNCVESRLQLKVSNLF
jgi:hypothetical protein